MKSSSLGEFETREARHFGSDAGILLPLHIRSSFAMESLYDRARGRAYPAGNGGSKTDMSERMAQLLSSDASNRVYPIRSVIGIDPKNSDSVSSSSNSQRTSRERGVSEGTESTPMSEQPDPGWGDPGWAAKAEHAGDDTETPYITTRFTHRVTEEGHMVVTGVAGAEKLQRCEVSSTSFEMRRQKTDSHFHGLRMSLFTHLGRCKASVHCWY